MSNLTLTHLELCGLSQEFNFADGHAYHDLDAHQQQIVNDLPAMWQQANQISKQQAELSYIEQFIKLSAAHCLDGYEHIMFCPTASNAIDMVGAWLATYNKSAALFEPTFDNLALLLTRRKIPLYAIDAENFNIQQVQQQLTKNKIDALFLVNPNNPTGQVLDKKEWQDLIDLCLIHNTTLIIDATFRFFVLWDYCLYQLLMDSGVSFICIEDSGKAFSSLEMKSSMVVVSNDLAKEMLPIYEEFYLRHSNFILLLIAQFMHDASQRGLDNTLHALVATRRHALRDALKDSILEIDSLALDSKLSVEWCQVKDKDISGIQLTNYLSQHQVGILPGSYFYWQQQVKGNFHIRISLLKSKQYFYSGLKKMSQALEAVTCIY